MNTPAGSPPMSDTLKSDPYRCERPLRRRTMGPWVLAVRRGPSRWLSDQTCLRRRRTDPTIRADELRVVTPVPPRPADTDVEMLLHRNERRSTSSSMMGRHP